MGMKMEDGAAQATLALLKIAKEIADNAFGTAEEATVREVFSQLCYESDARRAEEPDRELDSTRH